VSLSLEPHTRFPYYMSSILILYDHSFAEEPIIVLIVGDAKVTFRIHRKLICDASAMFRPAFLGNGTFTETEDQSMTLPEDDVETVARFVQWLYGQDYELAPNTDVPNTAKRYMQLAELYVLADKYDVIGLHNQIIDKLFEMKAKAISPPGHLLVMFVYQNTSERSSFRKLLVAHYALHIELDWYFEDQTKKLTAMPEFSADLVQAFARRASGSYTSPFHESSSKLHVAPKVKDSKS